MNFPIVTNDEILQSTVEMAKEAKDVLGFAVWMSSFATKEAVLIRASQLLSDLANEKTALTQMAAATSWVALLLTQGIIIGRKQAVDEALAEVEKKTI